LVFPALVAANASQSPAPPVPLVRVTMRLVPVGTLVALTDRLGDGPPPPLPMVKEAPADVPPPGAGEKTVTSAVPADARSAAPIAACSWLPLTNVVVRSAPFQRTTELDTNPEPFTVSVSPGPPAVAEFGEIELIIGAGLLAAPCTTTVGLVASRV